MINLWLDYGLVRLRREDVKVAGEISDKFETFEMNMHGEMHGEGQDTSLPVALAIINKRNKEVGISNIDAAYDGSNLNHLDIGTVRSYLGREAYAFDTPVEGDIRIIGDSNERMYAVRNGNGDTFTSFYAKIVEDKE